MAAGRARLIVAVWLPMVVRLDVALQLDMAAWLLEAVRLLVAVARAWRDGSGKDAAARLGCGVCCYRVGVTVRTPGPAPLTKINSGQP